MIVLDGRMAGHSGIGAYIRGLCSGWTESRQRRMLVLGDRSRFAGFAGEVVEAEERVYGLGEQWSLLRRVRKLSPDLYHVPHYNFPWFYRGKLVVTIHDLIPLLFPEYSKSYFARFYARAFLGRVVRRAARILTVSKRTCDDLVRFGAAPKKIEVTSNGIDERFRPTPAAETAERLKVYGLEPGGYVLYVGNIRRIKNVLGLIRAYQRAADGFPAAPRLVLAGRDQMPDETAPFRRDPRIAFLGEVDGDDLPALYGGAMLFAFPSFYEGFGLPPLEAMACGCPVVSSTGGSLPEVLGDAAVLVDPSDRAALAGALKRVMTDGALRSDLSARGLQRAARFSWKEAAERTFRVYEEVLSK